MSATATITREEALERLAAIAGHEHLRVAAEMIRVAPSSAQEIGDILRFAGGNGLAVLPLGSSSKKAWGNPVAAHTELSLDRMTALREHAWQDLTCTVQAGCKWAAMQHELSEHSQMVAADPLWPELATVGGVIAANDGGALRLKYGGLRDLVIGMTIVLADGTIAKTGGKVVKNVAGYDLHKLMIGSFGTLGVITEVNFRLHPIERHVRTWAVEAQTGLLAGPLRELLHSQMTLSGIQLCAQGDQCSLHVRICTRPECFDEHASRLRKIFEQFAITEASEAVWQAREQLFLNEDAVILKASVLPTHLCPIAMEINEIAVREGLEVALVGQATGLMTIAVGPAQDGAVDRVVGLIEGLRARLRPSGGSAVVLRMPDAMRGRVDVWSCQSDALPLMREIKRRFDPNRVLSPGRFVGGI